MRLLSLLLPALLAAKPAPVPEPTPAPNSQDPAVQLLERKAEEAMAQAGSPAGAAPLLEVHALRDEVDDLRPIALLEQTLGFGAHVNPFTRALAQSLYLDLERARGHTPRVQELNRRLGFVHDFYVLGGFDNEGKSGCGRDFGPEKALDLKATYSGKGHEVSWHKVSLDPSDGFIDLSNVVRPNHEVVAYALAFLSASRARDVTLALGTSGAHKLWVNGQLASSEDHYNQARRDQSRVLVHLEHGLNRVMLKVCQESGPLGFYLRTEGGAMTTALPDALPPLVRGGAPKRLPTLTSTLAEMVKAHPQDFNLRAAYATVLSQNRAFDESQHTDTVEADHAAELAVAHKAPSAQRAELELLAARLQTEDLNLRRRHLETALAAMPNDPNAELLLAQHELATGHPDLAQTRLQATLKSVPHFSAGQLLLARAEEELGDWTRASARLEAQFQETPALPTAVREGVRVSRRLDRPLEAADRLRVALALRYDDVASRRSFASLLSDLGRVDEASQELETTLNLEPFDNSLRMHLAELLCANGHLTEGLARFQEARALAPDDAEVFEREGRALLQAGRRDAALKSFDRALTLRPQNPGLREVVRSLRGETSASGGQYALDVRSLVKEADRYPDEDAVTLADYTYVKVQPSGLSSTFRQLGVKVYTQRGVEAYRSFPITYSPNRQEVRVLKARITKADGAVVESFSEGERNINEPWTGMYYDARAKVLSFPSLVQGDTLELQYRLDDTALDNLLSDYWGDVDFVQGVHPKVRYQFLVDMPTSRPLYWNTQSLGKSVVPSKTSLPEGRVLYAFKASGVAKIIPEPSMPGWAEVATTLHVSTYKTWDQVGRYYWGLVRDQLTPNDDLQKTVSSVLKGVNRKNELGVVRAIYNFVVSNTRYVALEFGIHGYKPYRVDRILARRFGDCKDKASLIHALLKLAGVDSRLVLLRMRGLGSLGDEPASLAVFNHAIVYVPKFDLYLDGTAEFTGATELPSADRRANVLIVEPDGNSHFKTTPEARAQDNVTTSTMEVTLKADGSADAHGVGVVAGQAAGEYRRTYQSVATRKATFEQGWAQTFPGLTVKKVGITDTSKLDQNVTLDYQLGIPRYSEVLKSAGLRFFPFGNGRTFTQSYATLPERKYDLALLGPWMNVFHYRYVLPRGYSLPTLPAPIHEESPFGHLTMTVHQEGTKLVCDGEIAFTQGRISVKDYPAFRSFVQRVDQAFARKLVVSPPAPPSASPRAG